MACAVNPDWAPCGRCDCIDGVSQVPDKWEVPGEFKTDECPRRSMPADLPFWTALLQHYRAGHLWTGGGISEQPQIYLDVMKTLEHWVDKLTSK